MDIVLNFYNIDAMTLNKAVILETTKVNTINSAIILFLFFIFIFLTNFLSDIKQKNFNFKTYSLNLISDNS